MMDNMADLRATLQIKVMMILAVKEIVNAIRVEVKR